LEEFLGDKLFVRSPRGVTPTPFGLLMLPMIERGVAALDTIIAEARRWSTPSGQTVRAGVSPLIDAGLVARTYSAVRDLPSADGPWQLVLREANMAELREGLVAGDLDLIVVPSVGPMPRYEHRGIGSEPLVLVEARAGDAGAAGSAALAALVGKELILMPDPCGLTTFTRDPWPNGSCRYAPTRVRPPATGCWRSGARS